MRAKTLAIACGMILLSALAGSDLKAGFVSGYTGHTNVVNPTAFINYAVYETTDPDWRNDFSGISAANINTLVGTTTGSESYVYFYSAWISSLSAGQLVSLTIPGPYLSAGFLYDTSLTLPDVAFVDDPDGWSPGPLITPVKLTDINTATPFKLSGGVAANPVSAPSLGTFSLNLSGGPTTVFFLTSSLNPIMAPTSLQTSSPDENPSLPTSTPEPGSLVLMGVGLAAVGVTGARRRFKWRRPKNPVAA